MAGPKVLCSEWFRIGDLMFVMMTSYSGAQTFFGFELLELVEVPEADWLPY